MDYYDDDERLHDELRAYFNDGEEWPPEGELEELLPAPVANTEALVSKTLHGVATTLKGITSEAERYYFLWRVLADLGKAKEDLATEIKANGLDDFACAGGQAYLEVSEHVSTRLDSKALEQALGKQALEPYRKASSVSALKVRYLGEASE